MNQMTEQKGNPLGYAPIGKLLAKFALPAVVSMLVNAVYNIVDQIFIGQGVGYLGNAATGGVSGCDDYSGGVHVAGRRRKRLCGD